MGTMTRNSTRWMDIYVWPTQLSVDTWVVSALGQSRCERTCTHFLCFHVSCTSTEPWNSWVVWERYGLCQVMARLFSKGAAPFCPPSPRSEGSGFLSVRPFIPAVPAWGGISSRFPFAFPWWRGSWAPFHVLVGHSYLQENVYSRLLPSC